MVNSPMRSSAVSGVPCLYYLTCYAINQYPFVSSFLSKLIFPRTTSDDLNLQISEADYLISSFIITGNIACI